MRLLDRRELPGFAPYLLPRTRAALERGDMAVTAVGAVCGRSAYGAAAFRLDGDRAVMTDLFVDAAVRRRGTAGRLLTELTLRAAAAGAVRLDADYVLAGPECAAMDALLLGRGFTPPVRRSRVFRADSADYRDDRWLGRAFRPGYRAPEGVTELSALPRAALEELEHAADISENLSWPALRDAADSSLCVALVQENRAAAYLLAAPSEDGGCALLSAVRRTGAPAQKLQIGDVTIDPESRQVWKAGEPVELTLKEYQLLTLLMRRPDHVFERQKLLGEVPAKADIGLYGSFATTGKGHGTDRALVAGLLGLRPDDPRLPDSFALAEEQGMTFTIHPVELRSAHPNTAVLHLTARSGRELSLKAASVGGGRIRVTEIDGVPADFGGDSNTLIIHNEDTPGCIAEVTMSLALRRINIASMQVFRAAVGRYAVMVLECDSHIPHTLEQQLAVMPGLLKVTCLNVDEPEGMEE